jgi:hypothetical protein
MPKFTPAIPPTATIKTRSGKYVDLLNPEGMIALIDIDDIGFALSKTNRFCGHTSRPYTVAEHCLLGVPYCLPANRLEFLMHDASEAYLGDTVGPLKRSGLFEAYRELEERWGQAIAVRFGLRLEIPREIHEVDKRMLVTEQRDLMGRPPSSSDSYQPFEGIISQVAPNCDEIAERFIAKFYELAKATVGAKK